jgi:hypothetical protein
MRAVRKRARMDDDEVIVIDRNGPTSPTTPSDAAASKEETGTEK